MNAATAKPIDIFRETAGAMGPGFLFSFNIADFKRRNSHLTHAEGDKDIAELDTLLHAMDSERVVSARVGGDRWLLFSRDDIRPRIHALLESYAISQSIWTGWKIYGARGNERATSERLVASVIHRAVRCLLAPVKDMRDLEAAILGIEKHDGALPAGRIIPLAEIPSMERGPWLCVTTYPAQDPACPFCSGQSFAWEGGDMSVYSGEGHCKSCGAEIDIRQVS